MKIFKYELKITDRCVINMPENAIILNLQVINEKPYIYAAINESNAMVERTFMTFGTGHILPLDSMLDDGFDYIGTYQLQGGDLVFHVFEQYND